PHTRHRSVSLLLHPSPPLFRLFSSLIPHPPTSTLFPYTTLFRSDQGRLAPDPVAPVTEYRRPDWPAEKSDEKDGERLQHTNQRRSEEHTSELQSLTNLVCRLLLEKKKTTLHIHVIPPAHPRHHSP